MRFRGYRGRDAQARALEASRVANTSPLAWALTDGSLVGVGEALLSDDGTQDRILLGAYGRTLLASEAQAAGLMDAEGGS